MRTRVGPFRRAALVGALVTGLVFALSAPALAAQVPVLPSTITPTVMAVAQAGPVAIPVQGTDRVKTAIEASKLFGTADTVVLATGNDFPDALGGSALAGAVGGPILLTSGATIEPAVLAEIDRLGATEVYILGGTGAVPAAVETALEAADLTVTRLAGTSRYETAAAVAEEVIGLLGEGFAGEAFLATGTGYADALAAAPIMYAKGMPLVLADGAGAFTLPAGVTKVDILGGTGVVPASVRTALGSAYGTRLAGTSRYETAIAVATFGVGKGMSWNELGIATGEGFADALAAGPLLGSKNSVLLMTQRTVLTPATEATLVELAGDVDTYYLFGGTGAIGTAVRADIQIALTPEPVTPGAHEVPDMLCTSAGCHANDLAMIHLNLAEGKIGCTNCHGIAGGPKGDCAVCHADAHSGAHPVVQSADPEACTQANCHAAGVVAIHADCTSCHNATSDVTDATCETCHDGTLVTHGGMVEHTVSGACFDSYCHGTDVAKMHGNDFRISGEEPPGCAACHAVGVTPSTTCLGACHSSANFGAWHDDTAAHADLKAGIEAESQECVKCHGSEVTNIASVEGEHKGCSCHAYFHAPGATSCVSCHSPHGFSQEVAPYNPTGTWEPMGGHNTTLFDVKGGTSVFGADGVVVKDSMGDIIEQEWPLPTAGVFWSQSNAVKQYLDPTFETTASVAATDSPEVAMDFRGFATPEEGVDALRLDVGWDSVITCYDCHTELEGLAGPQGANAANYGLDPNFPDDWTKAELTSWDPTGMRSIETTNGGTNPYYTTIGSNIHTPETEADTYKKVNIIYNDPSTATTVAPGAFYNIGVPASQGYSMGNTDPKRFLCQKCHKLTNSFQGQGIEGNGRGNRSNAMNYMGFSNYPHMEHHGDQIQGQGNCVSCHVAIPHGWKRPRLLVSERDPEPYKVQWVFAGYRDLAAAKDPNADLSDGNWGYLGPGSSNTLYKDLTVLNPDSPADGKYYSSHLEKVSASPNSHKILEAIPQEHFLHGQHDNHEADLVYEAYGFEPLKWDTWDYTTNGVNWHADTSNDRGHYNNCSACTSAGNRHDDSVAGVAPDVPYWK